MTYCFYGSFFLLCLQQEVIDEKLRGILGERTAEDDKKPLKKKKEKPINVEVEYTNGYLLTTINIFDYSI